MQMKMGKPRDFDLMHCPLYSKAKAAFDRNMKKATKMGVKSSRKEFDSLEPSDVREIYLKSDANNPRHVLENAFIGLGVARASRALAERLEETQSDLQDVKDENGEIVKCIFNHL